MSATSQFRSQRERMWRNDPRCHWCGCRTVLPPAGAGSHRKNIPTNEATIDHLDSRLSPDRGKFNGCYRRVLACLRCNNRRNDEEQGWLAFKSPQTLWERTGALYGIAKLSGALNEVCRP